MRTAFIRTLTAIAEKDSSVMLLTGDLGFSVLEEFRDRLPRQFLNAGVAEQNMIAVAAGLAVSGKRVFVYSIIPFVTFRCLEHIRNDVAYHNLNVCIVGVGGGYSYGHMGSTHHAIEDIAVLRAIPNMTVVCPGDPLEARAAVEAIHRHQGPVYLRLGKAGEPHLHQDISGFAIGKAMELRSGTDVTIIATGNMLESAVHASEKLKEHNVSAAVLSMHTVKPLDTDALRAASAKTKLIVTLEEHSRIGGLGSAVAEALSMEDIRCRHMLLSTPDAFAQTVGSQAYLREKIGLDVSHIVQRIVAVVRG